MKKYKFQLIKIIVLLIFTSGIVFLHIIFPIKSENLQTIQNNLITVSGILTGIIIAYLFAKQIQVIQKRESRQIEINHLSNKLTSFRKLLYRVINSHDFWTNYDDIKKYKKKYKGITFDNLHGNPQNKKKLASDFWLKEDEICSTTVDLYMAMEEIIGQTDRKDEWAYDRLKTYNYNLNYLSKCDMPSNQIWYYLEGRYNKHTKGLINDKGIWIMFQDDVRQYAAQIDKKYKDKDFDRHLLAQIGADFYELYIPRLIELTKLNEKGLSNSIRSLLCTLTIVLIAGVMVPLTIQLIEISECFSRVITVSTVLIVISGLTSFLFDFYQMLNKEIMLEE